MLDLDSIEPPIDSSTIHKLVYGIYDHVHGDLPAGKSQVSEIDPEKRSQLEQLGTLFDGETSLVSSFDWDNRILTVIKVDNNPGSNPPIKINPAIVLKIGDYSPGSIEYSLINDQETIDRHTEFTLLRAGKTLVLGFIENAYDLNHCYTRCIASSWPDVNATSVIIDKSGSLLTQVAHIGDR